jgi:hypothetical protein
MKTKTILFSILLAQFSFSNTLSVLTNGDGEPMDPKKEIHYKDIPPIVTNEYVLSFHDMHSQATFTLVRVEFENKTDGYLTLDLTKIGFTYVDKGTLNFKGYLFAGESKLIGPHDKKDFTVKVTDDGGWMQVNQFHLTVDGIAIYPADGMKITPPEFKLPASKNSIDAGVVSLNLLKVKQTTDVAAAQFEFNYKGQSAMVVDYSKMSIRTEAGQVYANVYKKSNPEFSFPNESSKGFVQVAIPIQVVDMQFATLYVQFNDAIQELQKEDLPKQEVNFEIDVAQTEAKAK